MIIQCDRCGTRFRLDDSRMTGKGVRVRCTKCHNVFMAAPPPPSEEIQLEDILGAAGGEPAVEGGAPGEDRAKRGQAGEKKENLAFDFREGSEKTEEGREAPSEENTGTGAGTGLRTEDGLLSGAPGVSGDEDDGSAPDQDFQFGAEGGGEGARDGWDAEDAGDDKEDFSFGFEGPEEGDADDKEVKEGTRVAVKEEEDDGELNFSFDTPELVNGGAAPSVQDALAGDAPKAAGAANEKVVPFAASGHARGALAPEKDDRQKPAPDEDFKEMLSQNLSREDLPLFDESGEGAEVARGGSKTRQRPASLGLVMAFLIVIVGGGLVYMTGAIDKLAKALTPGEAKSETVGIESLEGYYAENSNVGRVFVIQARIRNLTEEPQEIKAANGAVYDRSGRKLGSRSVSPGRVVSLEEVGSLSREDLLKAFKDPSGGVIPPRGTVPVMVVFTEAEGVAEYGIDIVR